MKKVLAQIAAILVCLLWVSSAYAATKTIGKIQSDSLRILVVQSDKGLSLALRASTPLHADDISLQTLSNPNRVIVDLPILKHSLATDKLSFNQHPLLRGIRVGAHPDKTRLVVDLSSVSLRSHSISSVEELGALLLNLEFDDSVSLRQDVSDLNIQADLDKQKQLAVLKNRNKAAAEASARSRLARTGAYLSSNGVITHRGQAKDEEVEIQRTGTLSNLEISQSRESELDSLILSISGVEQYSLTPSTEDNLYTLRLSDTKNEAKLPTSIGVGFEEISFLDLNPDLVVSIRLKDGVKLAPFITPDKLVLRAVRK